MIRRLEIQCLRVRFRFLRRHPVRTAVKGCQIGNTLLRRWRPLLQARAPTRLLPSASSISRGPRTDSRSFGRFGSSPRCGCTAICLPDYLLAFISEHQRQLISVTRAGTAGLGTLRTGRPGLVTADFPGSAFSTTLARLAAVDHNRQVEEERSRKSVG